MQGNLISNDPMVSAIFDSLDKMEGTPNQKLRAVFRAGSIAALYIGVNCDEAARAIYAQEGEKEVPAIP
jgi:hypothetical protein